MLVEELGLDQDDVTPQFSIRDQMDVDSLDMVEIVLVIESEFGIGLSDAETGQIDTVQDTVDVLERRAPP